jgi:hypothetical protein
MLYHEFQRVSQGVINADGLVWFAFRIRLPVKVLVLKKIVVQWAHVTQIEIDVKSNNSL